MWTAPLNGKGKPERLFFDRGEDGALTWSPDGAKLAFVSNRDGDHSFIGVYDVKTKPSDLSRSIHRTSTLIRDGRPTARASLLRASRAGAARPSRC